MADPDAENVALAWMRAVRESDLKKTTKLVLLTLGTRMDPDGSSCFPSTRTLADDTGLSRRTVEKHLREAASQDWIDRRERGRDKNTRWRSYQYLPRTPTLEKEIPQALGEGASQSRGDLGESDDETLGKELPLTSSSTSSERNGGHPGEEDSPSSEYPPPSDLPKDDSGCYRYPASFERIWDAYPSRDGPNPKKAGYRKVRALVRNGIEPGKLLAATEAYASRLEREGRVGTEFVKHASTFFGPDEHWREELRLAEENGTSDRNTVADRRAALDAIDGGVR